MSRGNEQTVKETQASSSSNTKEQGAGEKWRLLERGEEHT